MCDGLRSGPPRVCVAMFVGSLQEPILICGPLGQSRGSSCFSGPRRSSNHKWLVDMNPVGWCVGRSVGRWVGGSVGWSVGWGSYSLAQGQPFHLGVSLDWCVGISPPSCGRKIGTYPSKPPIQRVFVSLNQPRRPGVSILLLSGGYQSHQVGVFAR